MPPVLRGLLHSFLNAAVYRISIALHIRHVVVLGGLALLALMWF
jgi:hypothetical protein